METYLYEFEENILEEMYIYASERNSYYRKNPFKINDTHEYMYGYLIANSYCQYDPNYSLERIGNWILEKDHLIFDFLLKEKPPIFIKEILFYFKKFVDNITDDSILSLGLCPSNIRSFFKSYDINESIENIIEKLENIGYENFVANKKDFDYKKLIHRLWPYLMPYLFSEQKDESNKDYIIKCVCFLQASIDLVNKYKKQYYAWSSFYGFSYSKYVERCDVLSIKHLKDENYQYIDSSFIIYLSFIDNLSDTFMVFHEDLGSEMKGRYLKKAIILNKYVRPFYKGYLKFCTENEIVPNFYLDYNFLEEGVTNKQHFKNKSNEYYSSLDPKDALEVTIQKFKQLFEDFKSSGFIDEKTELDDFLFIFGLRESSKRDFHPIIWINPYNKKPGKELLIWTLKLLGYTEEEIKEGKPKLSIINSCFKQQFKHKDFPKTKNVLFPHEIGDDKNTILTIISRLKIGDDKWQTRFNEIQYELWNR